MKIQQPPKVVLRLRIKIQADQSIIILKYKKKEKCILAMNKKRYG